MSAAELLPLGKEHILSEKLDKIGADRDRAKEQRDKWDAKYKELCQKYIQQENNEIHEIVRAVNVTPDQLAEILAAMKNKTLTQGAAAEAAPAVIDSTTSENEEETKNEY